MKNTICDRCNKPIKGHVYEWRNQNLHERCLKICFEYVQMLKRNETTREERQRLGQLRAEAHRVMDRLWIVGGVDRNTVYMRLQNLLGVSKDDAHISKCNEDQLRLVIEHFGSMDIKPVQRGYTKNQKRPTSHSKQYRRRRNELREASFTDE